MLLSGIAATLLGGFAVFALSAYYIAGIALLSGIAAICPFSAVNWHRQEIRQCKHQKVDNLCKLR